MLCWWCDRSRAAPQWHNISSMFLESSSFFLSSKPSLNSERHRTLLWKWSLFLFCFVHCFIVLARFVHLHVFTGKRPTCLSKKDELYLYKQPGRQGLLLLWGASGATFIRWILRFSTLAAKPNPWVNNICLDLVVCFKWQKALRTGTLGICLERLKPSCILAFGWGRVWRGVMKYRKALAAAMLCCCISISRLLKRRFVQTELFCVDFDYCLAVL